MHKKRVALVRGAFLNPNELTNYEQINKRFVIESFSAKKPLGISPKIKNHFLFSPANYPLFGLTKIIANRTFGDSHYLKGLGKLLKPFSIIDVADPYYYFSYQAAQYKTIHPKIKLISTYCETIPHNNESTYFKKRLKYLVMKHVNLFIVHSLRSQRCLNIEGIKNSRIRIVKLGVDLKRFTPKLKRSNGQKILFVGRLVHEKGVWQLYQVFKQLCLSFPKISLTLVGSGQLTAQIKKDSQEQGIDHKITIKSVDYSQIHTLYQGHDLFVLPSLTTQTWEEQYGMALVEAMASGLPIITTNCGAIPEVVGSAALVCPQNQPHKLHQTLSFLIKKPQKQAELSRQSRARAAKHFDRRQFAAKIESIYEQICNHHSL